MRLNFILFFGKFFSSKYNREIKAMKGEVERLLMTVVELGLKLKGGKLKDSLFMVFENCFLFSKVMRTMKTYLISFSFLKQREYKKQ